MDASRFLFIRKSLGQSQFETAIFLDVSPTTVHRYERQKAHITQKHANKMELAWIALQRDLKNSS